MKMVFLQKNIVICSTHVNFTYIVLIHVNFMNVKFQLNYMSRARKKKKHPT